MGTSVMSELETILLTNDYGMSVEVINFGARIKSIKFPVNSKPMEMTVGYETAEEYLNDEFYLGATCGRVCNRIADGKFELANRRYQLTQNDGDNCLHGGADNFSLRYWEIDRKTQTNSSVNLQLISKDGDQGFPGTLNVSVTYQLSADNKLSIQYSANTDLDTIINLTNHAYFNLGENDSQPLYLQINSSSYLESDDANIPTGKVLPVDNTDYDFRVPVSVGVRQKDTEDESIKEKNGYDHCFILDKQLFEQPKAILTSIKNQVSLSVYSDQPAIQLYTGFYLNGNFASYQGLCLEAQNYTDAENNKHFPSNILKSKQEYNRKIIFGFSSIS